MCSQKKTVRYDIDHEGNLFITKTTLVALVVCATLALWIVTPDEKNLTEQLSRSESPSVSLAFLKELRSKAPDNRDISRQMIATLSDSGDYETAKNLAKPLLLKTDGTKDWDTQVLYLDILLKSYHLEKSDQETKAEIRDFISNSIPIKSREYALAFADGAQSIALPSLSFEILQPHAKSTDHYFELIDLALQSADYQNALTIQRDIFEETPSLENAKRLLDLFTSSGSFHEGETFVKTYEGELKLRPEYIRLTVEYAISVGNTPLAISQLKVLSKLAPSPPLISITAKLAVSQGRLRESISLLETTIVSDPYPEDLAQLHTLYTWVNDIPNALKMSLALLDHNPSNLQLRNGVEEARAMGDLASESAFYQRLVERNKLDIIEYSNWLNASEKARGTIYTLSLLKQLQTFRPNDINLLFHEARLLSYLGQTKQVVAIWHLLAQQHTPTTKEAEFFYAFFIQMFEPNKALDVLTTPKDWLNAGNEYLNKVLSLAWETNNRGLALLAINKQIESSYQQVDIYRYVRLNTPLTPNTIDVLTSIFQKNQNGAALYEALQAAWNIKDKKRFKAIKALALKEGVFDNNTDAQIYYALSEVDKGNIGLAYAHYDQALKISPHNPAAVSGLLWLSLEYQDLPTVESVYNNNKHPLSQTPEMWLVFANSAKTLKYTKEADFWYTKLLQTNERNSAPALLSYAESLENSGEIRKAYELRKYVAIQLTNQLFQSKSGRAAYQSLVAYFVSPSIAKPKVQSDILAQTSTKDVEQRFQVYMNNVSPDDAVFWYHWSKTHNIVLPDSQALSLAIQTNDKEEVQRLLSESLNLSITEQYQALQFTGQHYNAWQLGQNALGDIGQPALEYQLRKMHAPKRQDYAHGIKSSVLTNTQWDMSTYSVEYFSPHQNGNWKASTHYQITESVDTFPTAYASSEKRVKGNYAHLKDTRSWLLAFDLADGIGDNRMGVSAIYKPKLNKQWQLSLNVGVDNAISASQLLHLIGQSNRIGGNITYQPTAYESLTAQLNWHDITTRFGENVGHGWDLNIRAAEQLFFNDPAWQLYANYATQKAHLSDDPLDKTNQWLSSRFPITTSTLINEDYEQISLGHRLWHGAPGAAGTSTPSPNYWLDMAANYNTKTHRSGLAVSSGIGWRLVGNDELSLTVDWQSQDRNGQESMQISLGYQYGF
ncbi:tetratricopeptide repeat protein [Vibrio penaeicida]|uniref:Pellicle/biofilm biosynthesis protein PelB n=1 Tax=Vibrio penaeicida TaxID=104609 RepID=A0AAV5NXT7_9VIBR|nr:tetratricopeptide repeat protein [Vibrio penaeicida]RTZ22388.1 tetratricopeptide repeat protein [Vibrio penaeicida]GLQ75385.1 pellicle/biofilm biosynthesis protein PelB [Vibrio penaeicida]